MGRKKIKPKVTYVQVEKPDNGALEVVFDFLFNKFFEQNQAKSKKVKTPSKL